MSYAYRLMIDTGGEHPATVERVGDAPGAIGPILFQALGCNLGDLVGKTGGECLSVVSRAFARLMDPMWVASCATVLEVQDFDIGVWQAKQLLASMEEGMKEHPKAFLQEF